MYEHPYISKVEYLLVFLLLVSSGFLLAGLIPLKAPLIILISLITINYKIDIIHNKSLILFVFASLIVGLYHYYVFDGYIGNPIKLFPLLIVAGFFVMTKLGWRFRYAYFDIMYILCYISLIFWIIGLLVIPIGFTYQSTIKTLFIFNSYLEDQYRNVGPFWEPGAFSGYINLTGILFIDSLKDLYILNKKKVIIITLALMSTFSTQGYLVFFLIVISYLIINSKENRIKYVFIIIFFLIVSGVLYFTIPTLHNKISEQQERLNDWESEESLRSADRAVTTMVDLSNIKEYPFFGKTDQQELLYENYSTIMYRINYLDGHYGSGSGTTNYIASYGFVLFVIYILLIYRNFIRNYGNLYGSVAVVILLIMGFGELFFGYMAFMSLPFLKIERNDEY